MEFLEKQELVEGGIYEIRARNFYVGVWDGQGFIGIREKFNSEFLATEYFPGTARPVKKVGQVENVEIKETVGSFCDNCNKPSWWTGPPAPAPWACEGRCEETMPRARANDDLEKLIRPFHEEVQRRRGEELRRQIANRD